MESKDELKEIDIENCTCFYFDDVMRAIDIDFSDISLNERWCKIYENILIYNISCKTTVGVKPLGIWFDNIDGFIKIYDGIRYLVLFGSEKYNAVYNRTRYFISEKSDLTNSVNHYFWTNQNWFV